LSQGFYSQGNLPARRWPGVKARKKNNRPAFWKAGNHCHVLQGSGLSDWGDCPVSAGIWGRGPTPNKNRSYQSLPTGLGVWCAGKFGRAREGGHLPEGGGGPNPAWKAPPGKTKWAPSGPGHAYQRRIATAGRGGKKEGARGSKGGQQSGEKTRGPEFGPLSPHKGRGRANQPKDFTGPWCRI